MRRAVVDLAAGLGGAALLACAAPAPLDVVVPTAAIDRALVLSVRDAEHHRLYAFDPARASSIPAALADIGSPVELTAFTYDEPLAQLGFAGAPGLVAWAAPGDAARALGPWSRALTRTVTTDDGGEWSALAELPAPLAGSPVARTAECGPLEQRVLPVPAFIDHRVLVGGGDDHALLVLADERGADRWFRVGTERVEAIDAPVPELRTTAAVRAPDGALWLAGRRGTATGTVVELWLRAPGASTFEQVPASPGMVESPDGEITWLAPLAADLLWMMNRTGVIERRRAGAWDRRHQPSGTVVRHRHGALVAHGEDDVVALLPYVYGSDAARHVVRIRGTEELRVSTARPRPSTLMALPTLDLTLVGTTDGTVVLLADHALDDRHGVPAAAHVQAMAGARFGGMDGVLYSGINGFLREYYPTSGLLCSHPQIGFNVTDAVRVGHGWIVSGTRHAMGNPPRRLPAAAWMSR